MGPHLLQQRYTQAAAALSSVERDAVLAGNRGGTGPWLARAVASRRSHRFGVKILVTGICGFVGGALAEELKRQMEGVEILGIDNLSRPGSEQNRQAMRRQGVLFRHGDLRNPSDLENLPAADWVIDAAANPSVLAGVAGETTSRQLMEHNLVSTIHLLEYCKRHGAGAVLLSTS